MKIQRKKIGNWDALVYTDKDEVCITLDGEGGAVIGSTNYADAELKFLEAMNLFSAIQRLNFFKKHGYFTR